MAKTFLQRCGLALAACFLLGNLAIGQTQDGPAATKLLQEAAKLQNAGKYAEAAGKWQTFIKEFAKDPALGQAYMGLGTCLLEIGQFGEAVTAFDEAIKHLPKEETGATIRWNLAVAHYRRADQQRKPEYFQEAAKALEGITGDSKATPERHSLATYYLARTEQAQGKEKEARKRLADLLSKPRDPAIVPPVLLALGSMAFDAADWPEAIRHYRSFLKDHAKEPGADQARLGLADALIESGQEGEGVKLLAEACQMPEAEIADYGLFRLGDIALARTKAKEAAEHLALQVKHHPKSGYRSQSLGLLGRAHFQLKEYDQAAAILEQNLQEFPKQKERAGSELALAQAYYAAGKLDKAEPLAKKLGANAPAAPDQPATDEELRASARFLSARIAVGQGKPADALTFFESILASKSKLANDESARAEAVAAALAAGDGKRGLAWADDFSNQQPKSERAIVAQLQAARWLAEKGQFQEALPRCQKLIESKKETVLPSALYLAGHCSMKLRQFEEGAKLYRRLIADNPKFEQLAVARFSLGVCEESRGAITPAVTAYQDFLKSHPDHPLAEQVKERLKLLQK